MAYQELNMLLSVKVQRHTSPKQPPVRDVLSGLGVKGQGQGEGEGESETWLE